MFKGKFAQDEMTHQRLRVGSKKSVQQGRAWFSVSRRGPPLFYAQSVPLVREHGKMARTPLAAFFNRPIPSRLETQMKIEMNRGRKGEKLPRRDACNLIEGSGLSEKF
jgi:hypothetical protein